MKFSWRSILWLLLGVIVVAAGVYAMIPQPVQVETVKVRTGPLQVSIDEDGKTRIRDRYVVSSPVAGRLRRIELREGDEVTQNTTLLALIEPGNPDLLDARGLAQAEARVKASEAAVQRAIARREQAKTELGLAESEFGRYSQLIADKTVSQSEFDKVQARFRAQSEEFRSAKFDEDIATFELDMANAALLHANSRPGESDRFQIKSPITGRVLRVIQKSSTIVPAGAALLEIGDPQDLEIEIDVLSSDAVKISVDDPVILEHWGGEQPLRGTVRRIEPAAFSKVSALGVEEQRVNIIVEFNESPEVIERLGDGYRVEARIIYWQEADVLQVPTSALFRYRDSWAVFVATGEGELSLTKVEIGQRNDNAAEIVSGLSAEQIVVIHPDDKLADGTKVTTSETVSALAF